jgi:hypothetical protein
VTGREAYHSVPTSAEVKKVRVCTFSLPSSGLQSCEYGHGDLFCSPRDSLYLNKLALISPTSDGRLVDIVRLQSKVMEFSFFIHLHGMRLS